MTFCHHFVTNKHFIYSAEQLFSMKQQQTVTRDDQTPKISINVIQIYTIFQVFLSHITQYVWNRLQIINNLCCCFYPSIQTYFQLGNSAECLLLCSMEVTKLQNLKRQENNYKIDLKKMLPICLTGKASTCMSHYVLWLHTFFSHPNFTYLKSSDKN